jgi:anti-sigma factor RsiW
MSTNVSPEELSALLDGELGLERAAEVRQALAEDPALQARYGQLAELDRTWKAAAEGARFASAVPWQAPAPRRRWPASVLIAVAVPLLAMQRLAQWPASFNIAIAIHAAVLAILLACIAGVIARSEAAWSAVSPEACTP